MFFVNADRGYAHDRWLVVNLGLGLRFCGQRALSASERHSHRTAAKRKAIAGVTLAKVKQEMERVPVKVPVAAASAVCGNPQPHERSGERGKKSNLQDCFLFKLDWIIAIPVSCHADARVGVYSHLPRTQKRRSRIKCSAPTAVPKSAPTGWFALRADSLSQPLRPPPRQRRPGRLQWACNRRPAVGSGKDGEW